MKVKSNVKAGGMTTNRCESVGRGRQSGLKVKTGVKSGGWFVNRCESVRRA